MQLNTYEDILGIRRRIHQIWAQICKSKLVQIGDISYFLTPDQVLVAPCIISTHADIKIVTGLVKARGNQYSNADVIEIRYSDWEMLKNLLEEKFKLFIEQAHFLWQDLDISISHSGGMVSMNLKLTEEKEKNKKEDENEKSIEVQHNEK